MALRPTLTINAWLRFGHVRGGLRGLPRRARVLEIGAGEGALGARLAERFDYVGVEADETAAAVSAARVQPRGGTLLVGLADDVLEDSEFDALVACEVLEHLEDDAAALRSWRERVRPGGLVVLSVPARPERFGPWDVSVGHYRRYDRRSLRRAAEEAGLEVVRLSSYGWPVGLALEAVRNRLAARRAAGSPSTMQERTAGSGRVLQPGERFAAVTWLVALPFRALQWPFRGTDLGTGLVVVLRRPKA